MSDLKKAAVLGLEAVKILAPNEKVMIIIFANENKRHTVITNQFETVKLCSDLNAISVMLDNYKK